MTALGRKVAAREAPFLELRWAWGALVVSLLSASPGAAAQERVPPIKLLVGYWHNWMDSPVTLRLGETSEAFDVVDVAFAIPTVPGGSTMSFAPDPAIYPTEEEFIREVQDLQRAGKTVLISIGGAADPVIVDDPADVAAFVDSMTDILLSYGFDGIDIDLEGTSLYLDPGDADFRDPTSLRIVYFIEAVQTLMDLFPEHVLSAAPETAFVQGGYQSYGGIWGAYLPVIHALRDRLSFVHVQHYNTGSMFGRDGVVYEPATADFHVAMADMLLAGFTVDNWGNAIDFDPLHQEQVAIGLPAGPSAADGYTPPEVVHDALDYLILGIPFGGQYELADPSGYPAFRGLMTWSINWDVYHDRRFSTIHREYLDGLLVASVPAADGPEGWQVLAGRRSWPNPAASEITIRYELRRGARVGLELFDVQGRAVLGAKPHWREAGIHTLRLDVAGLPSGVYPYRIRTAKSTLAGTIVVTH
ncbi:MAG: T9SS type A sorting domain-containing protein [Candidatus Eisenbacteria bacterium]|nr:T9SS type A sorting domain-containing protein [Candidatus Eisenbacteria bacterium]